MPEAKAVSTAPYAIVNTRNQIAALAVQVASPGLQQDHAKFVEAIATIPPNRIEDYFVADQNDLQLRADTFRCNVRAFATYVSAFIRDTADHSPIPIGIDRKWVDDTFDDFIGDIVGKIAQAAERIRLGEAA